MAPTTQNEPGFIHPLEHGLNPKTKQLADSLLQEAETFRLNHFTTYKKRQKYALIMTALIGIPLAVLDYALVTGLILKPDGFFAGLTILFALFIWRWMNKPKRDYAKLYKNKILPEIARLFGNFHYDAKGRISEDILSASQIMPLYDTYESEDYFYGTYKNTKIAFSEIALYQKRKNKEKEYDLQVFKGLAILFEVPHKRFHGRTIIDENRTGFGSWFKEKATKLKHANMVDPAFEDRFDVYTNDQVEARYLVHPLVIENLVTLSNEYEGQKITAAFFDQSFLILIRSKKNHFEPPHINIPATTLENLYHLEQEIASILAIGDHIELYNSTN